MVARAMASSMIVNDGAVNVTVSEKESQKSYDLNNILTDWFKHGNK